MMKCYCIHVIAFCGLKQFTFTMSVSQRSPENKDWEDIKSINQTKCIIKL